MNRCAGAITRTMEVPGPGEEMFKVIVPLEMGQRIGQSLMRLCCTLSSCAPKHLHPEPSTENSCIYLKQILSQLQRLHNVCNVSSDVPINNVFGVPLQVRSCVKCYSESDKSVVG